MVGVFCVKSGLGLVFFFTLCGGNKRDRGSARGGGKTKKNRVRVGFGDFDKYFGFVGGF